MKPIFHWARSGALALALLAPAAFALQTETPKPPQPAPVTQTPVPPAGGTQPPVTKTTPEGTTQTPVPGTKTTPGGTTQTPIPVAGGQKPVTVNGPGGVTTTVPPAQDHAGHDHGQLPHDQGVQIPAGTPPGRLEVSVTDHDFGQMIEGEIARHNFEMKSAGDNPLIIAYARPTCGCTVTQAKVEGEPGQFVPYTYGQPIPVGKRIQIEAELNTKNKHNQASSKINLLTNDPRGIVTVGLTAFVDTYFAATPAALDFGELSTSDVRELSSMVTAKRGGKFKLHQEGFQNIAGMKIEYKPINPDEQGAAERWEVKVTLGPDGREGNMGYPVQLRSDQLVPNAPPGIDGKVPSYGASITVQARVRGLISYEPPYLSFGITKPGMQVTRTFKISCFDDKFQLTQPKSMKLVGQSDAIPEFRWAAYFDVVAKPSLDGKSMDVDVTLKGMPEGTDSAFQGRVMIETGHPARPTVAVLFSGVCRMNAPTPPPPPLPPPSTGKN